MEDLPGSFDVVILGTGLPESIIAAASSRLDKSVLQLDSNAFYGRDWAGFRLDDFRDHLRASSSGGNSSALRNPYEIPEGLIKSDEIILEVPCQAQSVTNFEEVIYAKNETVEPDIAPQSRQERYRRLSQRHPSGSSIGSNGSQSESSSSVSTPTVSPYKPITFEDVLSQTRKFSLDIAPKLFWTNDAFVNLLTNSNISRYTAFRLVQVIATAVEGRIVEVPFSRSGIFNYADLDASDKRRVMKFMQTCTQSEGHEKELEAAKSLSIKEYLSKLKIPLHTVHSIVNAIALCSTQTPAVEAFSRVRRFLAACGRYSSDSSPFLFPIYGCGEYPQYFARISAVFGGIQYLKRGIDFIVMDSSLKQVNAIISEKKRIDCQSLVIPVEYMPAQLKILGLLTKQISRAVLITSGSLFVRHKPDAAFMRLGKEDDELGVIIVEGSPNTEICPKDYHVVYMWMKSIATAREDLEPYVKRFFEPMRADYFPIDKPKVLWVCYYNHAQTIVNTTDSAQHPKNIRFVSGPDGSLDYESVLEEATGVFRSIYPDVPFLPRVPDPEDVILDGGENAESGDKSITVPNGM
ncbi:rab proteins geranylgeranyltransferase component A-like [Paramacrobiotus metropolitanus]|uniref:rab proteins geranylgeranyltransferase component A-like n=1 Tax=Paramacrobiotus metropolitanus TaxID=2943436 RepID=UPI002445D6DF|nr:rab proteins geranylgeranyltransferase component A-like [Paramacrobiotus metropolitanus]